MYTGNYFLRVVSELILDAVKYSFSVTSVRALIFLLRLNYLSNKMFLPFWAAVNDLTCTPSFHNAVSSSISSSCPQPMAVAAVIPSRLSLVSLWLREAQRIPLVLENRRSSQGGGGAHPLHPPPRSTPLSSVLEC